MLWSKPLSCIAAAGAIVVGAALAPKALAADTLSETCLPRIGSQENCVPIVGCLGDEGDHFVGRAIGWDNGTFEGLSRSMLTCFGEWTTSNALGLGQANIYCDEGLKGVAYFAYQDVVTGTATGQGVLSDGSRLRMWSGHNIQQFIQNQTGDVDARLMCGEVPVPIG